MALVTRSPVRVTAAPSTAPQEAMAASLQAHIDELVQKNRTCEHTIRRLQQALADEKERGTEAVTRLKTASQQEREAWREGCDSLLGAHRIVHLRTRIELDKERLNVQLEKEENRRERLNILHRDYRLTLFQAKESDLEAKVAALEESLEDLTEEHEQDALDYMERIGTLGKELQRADKLRKEAVCRLKGREAEFDLLQSEASALRTENDTLKASSESASVKLERTTLQLEGAKTSLAEIESANAELKRTNADLKRQLDRWQNLETKGGAEVEEMRKRRIELEVQVKELQSRVKELEKADKESAKILEKERNKVAKLKKENDRMAEVTEEAQAIAKKSQEEYEEAAKHLKSAQKLIEKLQSDKIPKSQIRKGNKTDIATLAEDVDPGSLEPSEREVEKVLTPNLKTRARPRPAHRGHETADAEGSVEEQEEEPSQAAKRRARGKPTIRDNMEAANEKDDGKSAQGKRAGKARNRSREESSNAVRKRKNKSPAGSDPEQDEASEEEIEDDASEKIKDKGKQKAVVTSSGSEDDSSIKTKTAKGREKTTATDDNGSRKSQGTKARQKSKDSKGDDAGPPPSSQSKSRKPSSSQGPRIRIVEDKGDADAQPKKKKKRLFPPSQAETFPWDDLPKATGFGGLNIPTQLSPVKETDAVPARSVFGKVGSAFGLR